MVLCVVYLSLYIYVCIYIYICMCVCIYIYIYIYMYVGAIFWVVGRLIVPSAVSSRRKRGGDT